MPASRGKTFTASVLRKPVTFGGQSHFVRPAPTSSGRRADSRIGLIRTGYENRVMRIALIGSGVKQRSGLQSAG